MKMATGSDVLFAYHFIQLHKNLDEGFFNDLSITLSLRLGPDKIIPNHLVNL